MRKRKLLQHINKTRDKVQERMSAVAADGGKYAHGLSGEGYRGGYRDALDDVMLLLNDVMPNRRGWWS